MPPGTPMLTAGETPALSAANTGFILLCSALVMLMTPGLAFFYGGMVRSRSTLNMLMMSFAALGVVTVLWVLYGFGVAFGTDFGSVVGWSPDFVGLSGVGRDRLRDGYATRGGRVRPAPGPPGRTGPAGPGEPPAPAGAVRPRRRGRPRTRRRACARRTAVTAATPVRAPPVGALPPEGPDTLGGDRPPAP